MDERLRKFYCCDCGNAGDYVYFTEINPEGGYGRQQALVCDDCMRSGRWDYWKSQHWPNWPLPREAKA